MAETLKGRDKRAFNIWSFYSPKAGADIIVAGDPEYLHAHLLEGDPQVEHFRVGGDIYLDPDHDDPDGTKPDAIVQMRNTPRRIFREVKAVDEETHLTERDLRQRRIQERVAAKLDMVYERIGPSHLRQHATLINNWRFLRPAIAAARGHDLTRYIDDALSFVGSTKRSRLREYFTAFEDRHELRLAGLLRALQTAQLKSDLDLKIVSMGTWLWLD